MFFEVYKIVVWKGNGYGLKLKRKWFEIKMDVNWGGKEFCLKWISNFFEVYKIVVWKENGYGLK